jgi:transposase
METSHLKANRIFAQKVWTIIHQARNDAERALRPVVIHRQVSGGARSDWGGQLVAMMFSFLETMRLQGKNALTELLALLTSMGREPPQTV